MTRKYTIPCPHCGGPMEREATITEQAAEVIELGIHKTYAMASRQTGWPGTISVTQEVLAELEQKGIKFADVDGDADTFDRGYVAGLEAARAVGLTLGSPLSAKLTEMIEMKKLEKGQ